MFLSRSEEIFTEQKERWTLKRSVESHPFYLEWVGDMGSDEGRSF